MNLLPAILIQVIFPVFLLIGLGAVAHRRFDFDLHTLSKLLTYILMPAVAFVNIYESEISGGIFVQIVGFLLLQNLSLIILSSWLARVLKWNDRLSPAFKNSIVLNNSGNFGIPVSQLVFQQNPLGMSVQIVVMIFQNLLTYTYGLFNSISVDYKGASLLRHFLKLPIFYALLLGLILHLAHVDIPAFLWNPLTHVSGAFMAVALITLGAQVAHLKVRRLSGPLAVSIAGRLVLSPLVAFLIIWSLGLSGTVAQALFIASSFPTSRNSALLALEYGNYPEYAAQAVLATTLMSSMTVTVVVYLAKIWF